jgi:hypothetical protein
MHRNLNGYESGARLVAAAVLLFLSFAVFVHPVAQLLVILAAAWLAMEGICGCCPFYANLGLAKGALKPETSAMLIVAGIQVVLGYVWWHAGWEKIVQGVFASQFGHNLAVWAAHNPYPFMRGALLGPMSSAAGWLGWTVEFLEYFIGIGLVALAYAIMAARTERGRRLALAFSVGALSVGMALKGVFFFAAAHTNEYAGMASVLIFWTSAVLVYGYAGQLAKRKAR